MASTISRSMPRGVIPADFQISLVWSGARPAMVRSPFMEPNSASIASERSFAISFSFLFSTGIPYSPASRYIFFWSVITYPSDSPIEVLYRVSTMSRPWSEWAAAPVAMVSRRLRETIRSASAPHTPRILTGGMILQGPIAHLLQDSPAEQYLQGGCWISNLSQTVSIPSLRVISIIGLADSSIVLCWILSLIRSGFIRDIFALSISEISIFSIVCSSSE